MATNITGSDLHTPAELTAISDLFTVNMIAKYIERKLSVKV